MQEGLNAVPTTDKEKADCKKWLSPQNLHQIVVGKWVSYGIEVSCESE